MDLDQRRTWKIVLVSPDEEKTEVHFHLYSKELPTKEQIMALIEGQLNRLGIMSGQPVITAVMETKAVWTKEKAMEYTVLNGRI